MDGAPSDPLHKETNGQAADGGPFGVGDYERHALRLIDNGYEPIPIRRGRKVPAVARWSQVTIDESQVSRWVRQFPDCGVGLRTGRLVGLDIDILDADQAWQVADLAERRFGRTLVRVGRWPKRLLLYRTAAPFAKIDVKPVEVLGHGQQFVAFGLHPDIAAPYSWPLGETPLDVPLDELPEIDRDGAEAFVAEARALLPISSALGSGRRRSGRTGDSGIPGSASGPVRDDSGRVIDGRDAWLSTIAFHAIHDAVDSGDNLDADILAERIWERFECSTELSRPAKGGATGYVLNDARRKVADKLRLLRDGRLPSRATEEIASEYVAPGDDAEEARRILDSALREFCDRLVAWHGGVEAAECPRLGLRATVGLGKSSASRRHLAGVRERLKAADPDRIVVFTPSHDLAEESAAAWEELGLKAAVLRGYERIHPALGAPMCRDVEAVTAALATRLNPQDAVCANGAEARCPHFHGCLKQRNRDEIRSADVVVAPYDALYTGFAVEPETVALLVIDEGCWARAKRHTDALTVEALLSENTGSLGSGMYRNVRAGQMADRLACRKLLHAALAQNGPGALRRSCLVNAGLTAEDCRDSAGLERQRLVDPMLRPGLTGAARGKAIRQARENGRILKLVDLWGAVGDLVSGSREMDGRVRIAEVDDGTGTQPIHVTGLAGIHPNFREKPILHLDATLRPEIADVLLPSLEHKVVEAAAPNMNVTLVTGSFGKTRLAPDGLAGPDEQSRRARNLADCVDYVRWHARRVAPGKSLVITYKSGEDAFRGIPGVDVAHFNAIAGIDAYRDVAALFLVGRPLARDTDLAPFCAAFQRHVPEGSYEKKLVGVRMRDGSNRGVRVVRHQDEKAEVFRAAICDDELIQAIGRGRGVNRTSSNPLEVHVLADVALPLVHDRVVTWEAVKPDVVQRMLLAGLAVDSPADAAVLHPHLFTSANAAKLAFGRTGFKGHFPISTYRGLTLKSAAYRRSGRGRGWQQAYWIDDRDLDARAGLEVAFGDDVQWIPN